MKTVKDVITELEGLFSKMNEHFFAGSLEQPIITCSPDTSKGAYGWCTAWKAWLETDGTDKSYYEINMCAEYLTRPMEETAGTLLHEMVHLFNLQEDIKDCSRGGSYHNKKFKVTAEEHGLIVDQDSKYGWCRTRMNEDTLEWFKKLDIKDFSLTRSKMVSNTESKKSSSKKYVCPDCGTIVRATKEVRITCTDCDVEYELED